MARPYEQNDNVLYYRNRLDGLIPAQRVLQELLPVQNFEAD